jgi:hypothetical protein
VARCGDGVDRHLLGERGVKALFFPRCAQGRRARAFRIFSRALW